MWCIRWPDACESIRRFPNWTPFCESRFGALIEVFCEAIRVANRREKTAQKPRMRAKLCVVNKDCAAAEVWRLDNAACQRTPWGGGAKEEKETTLRGDPADGKQFASPLTSVRFAPLSISLYLALSLSLSISISLALSLSLSISLALLLSLSLSLSCSLTFLLSLSLSHSLSLPLYRRLPPCAVKTCAVRPVFARLVGKLQAADPSNVQGPLKQNASTRGTIWGSETNVEARAGAEPRTRKSGQSAHAGATQGLFPWLYLYSSLICLSLSLSLNLFPSLLISLPLSLSLSPSLGGSCRGATRGAQWLRVN